MFSLKDASAVARQSEVSAAIDAVDQYLQSASGPERFRRARGDADAALEVAAYRGLEQVGATSAFIPEHLGGSGFAPGVSVLISERLGWSLAREPFVENVVLPISLLLELREHAPAMEALNAISDAGQIHCVAWQEGAFALPEPPAIRTRAIREGAGLRIVGRKRFVVGARACEQMIVLAAMDGEHVLACVPMDAPGVHRQDKLLADGTFWSDMEFDVVVDRRRVLADGTCCMSALTRALDFANLALAGMLYGLQSRILALTLDYLGTRVQFDKPLGAFQALQHRAVDLYTHAQIARFLLGEAVDALIDPMPSGTLAAYASRSKARVVDAGLRIAKEGIQMHGGIGFSDEYDLGLYVKRVLVLSAWLGGADWHRRRCAAVDPSDVED